MLQGNVRMVSFDPFHLPSLKIQLPRDSQPCVLDFLTYIIQVILSH